MDNNIFEDYLSWKSENKDLITSLVKKQSKTIRRFSPVLAVVDYLSEENTKRKLSEDELLIFSDGFDYIHDQFMVIQSILETTFNNNVEEMEKCAQTINLLLYVEDFQTEIDTSKNKKELNNLNDLEQKINDYIDKKENAPDEYFLLLDDIIAKIAEKSDTEIHTIDQIFYEIAIEYEIYDEDDFNVYNDILNKQIEKTRGAN
jgi:hypothetical protein